MRDILEGYGTLLGMAAIGAVVSLLLGGCAGNIQDGVNPITVPTGSCTIRFDGSWTCEIGGAGGPVPEAVVPVEPAPTPVVPTPSGPMTPEGLNDLAPGQAPPSPS